MILEDTFRVSPHSRKIKLSHPKLSIFILILTLLIVSGVLIKENLQQKIVNRCHYDFK